MSTDRQLCKQKTRGCVQETSGAAGTGSRADRLEEGVPRLPGREDLLVLQLLHSGGGSHRHGDDDVVDVEGALASPPLDRLLLGDEEREFIRRLTSGSFINHYIVTGNESGFLTGVLGTLWLPSGVAFSDDVDSWRVRGL